MSHKLITLKATCSDLYLESSDLCWQPADPAHSFLFHSLFLPLFDSHTHRYGAVPHRVQLRLCSVLCGEAQRTTVARKRRVWRGHAPLPSSDLFFSPLTTFSALLSSALCGHGSRNTCICSAVSAVWEEEFRFQYNFIYVTTEE